jgi:hypothetical protein
MLLQDDGTHRLLSSLSSEEIPEVPVRKRLRPCCAFGSELRARLGPIPIPGFSVLNVRDAEDLGPHTYDSGLLQLGYEGRPGMRVDPERNGLVYTCRGGFIDTAHVRDYVDWTLFLASRLGRHLATGVVLDLPAEGGARRVILRPVDAELIDELGTRRLTLWLAERLGSSSQSGTRSRPGSAGPRSLASARGRRPSRPRTSTRTCSECG